MRTPDRRALLIAAAATAGLGAGGAALGALEAQVAKALAKSRRGTGG